MTLLRLADDAREMELVLMCERDRCHYTRNGHELCENRGP